MEKKLSDINFFICSTYIDLKNYREEVIKKIQSQAGLINAQEFFGARDNKPIETCLKEVEQSNVFIMFLAFRFGSKDKASGKYFVESEYEMAKELKLPKFIYFMDKENPFPPMYVATGQEAIDLKVFKEKLKDEHTIDSFTTTEDLTNKVSQHLLKELPKEGFKIGRQDNEEVEINSKEIIKKFITLPKVYYGTEVVLNVKLGVYESAQENECNAFSLRYGATAKRKFSISESEKVSLGLYSIHYIYAENERAKELISLPDDKNLTLVLKTIQGILYWDDPIYELRDAMELYDPNVISTASLWSGMPRKIKFQTGSVRKSNLICALEFLSSK